LTAIFPKSWKDNPFRVALEPFKEAGGKATASWALGRGAGLEDHARVVEESGLASFGAKSGTGTRTSEDGRTGTVASFGRDQGGQEPRLGSFSAALSPRFGRWVRSVSRRTRLGSCPVPASCQGAGPREKAVTRSSNRGRVGFCDLCSDATGFSITDHRH
jgi:hypothetical protein